MTNCLRWGNESLTIDFAWSADSAPRIAAVTRGPLHLEMPEGLPLVELLTVSNGHSLASDRLVHTLIGHEARYVSHRELVTVRGASLSITVQHPATLLELEIRLELLSGVSVIRSTVVVTNGGTEPMVLRALPTLSVYLGGDSISTIRDWTVSYALSDWLGEGRWVREKLDGVRFPQLEQHLTDHNPRGEFSVVSTGTWSTGKYLPVGTVTSSRLNAAWGWQIEHNGPWRWELGEDTASAYLALSGPTDSDHQWTHVLAAGETFVSVPVALAFARDFSEVIAELTEYRRRQRRAHPDNTRMPVVFNDYMNTLNGDPTTEKLLPLIDTAAEVGAQIFCIDAGWYDDSGDWWDTVGEWVPSTTRFPGGLGEVVDHITKRGMVPGLWLEPEVIGVKSPVANQLPDEAFLQRNGQRIVEHSRYHLDLRHPDARAHLDGVIDRLVAEFGIGFFKLDYNINPGPGTDHNAHSVGAGLLDHNRAHLDWLDSVLDRHPTLVLENCASGAMRADFALLSRLNMQSTSDQQDYLAYPPIAAMAPAQMLPEQAASWAYPQPNMSEEEVAFCLSTGLLGRFYLSGHLSQMDQTRRALVAEAVSVAQQIAPEIQAGTPIWPLGFPMWDARWVSVGLNSTCGAFVLVWDRDLLLPGEVELALPYFTGTEISVTTVFPRSLPSWDTHWDAKSGVLRVVNPIAGASARLLRIDAVHNTVAAPYFATQTGRR